MNDTMQSEVVSPLKQKLQNLRRNLERLARRHPKIAMIVGWTVVGLAFLVLTPVVVYIFWFRLPEYLLGWLNQRPWFWIFGWSAFFSRSVFRYTGSCLLSYSPVSSSLCHWRPNKRRSV